MESRHRGISLRDYVDFAIAELGQRKLRTFLTSFGVTVGIAALVAMLGFGKGMQKNVTENFARLDVFNSLTVMPAGSLPAFFGNRGPAGRRPEPPKPASPVLDDAAVKAIGGWRGVESVYPEIRFPAMVRLGEAEEFRLVQVLPARVAASKAIVLTAGRAFSRDEENAALVSRALLRQLNVSELAAAVGRTITIASLSFDWKGFDPSKIGAYLSGARMPFKTETAAFTIAGVTDASGFSGPGALGGDVIIPPGPAGRLPKLPFTNVWDLFRAGEGRLGYAAVNVRLESPAAAEGVKRAAREMGFSTFALVDQFEQIKTSFIYMDIMLAAVGMIAIFVAALGIINTMVMSVLERTSEIGIMKSVGASPRDIQKVFFFESGAIGLMGGLFGLALGWAASRVINRVIVYFAARQGLPPLDYFHFPLWLCFGAIAFAILVSLASGVYPARRAAKVDPAVALRHE